jgi:hypothetical protein
MQTGKDTDGTLWVPSPLLYWKSVEKARGKEDFLLLRAKKREIFRFNTFCSHKVAGLLKFV